MKLEEPTLVLLPGLDGTGLLFERLVSALPPDLLICVVQYPSKVPLSISEYAAIAVRQMPAGRIILLAESFSGLIALHLLRERLVSPECIIFVASFDSSPLRYLHRLSALFLILAKTSKYLPKVLWRYFCIGPNATDADISWLKAALAQVEPAVIAHRLRIVALSKPVKAALIELPAFYLHANEDRLIPQGAMEELSKLFKKLNIFRINGPHFLLQAMPTECAEIIASITRDSVDGHFSNKKSAVLCNKPSVISASNRPIRSG